MLLDLRTDAFPPDAGPYDVCIAGAGMAGITAARALAGRGCRVLLLEAGGTTRDPASQLFYQGRNLGRGYFDLDASRFRQLGGTSCVWGGWSRPLDSADFQAQPDEPLSGWPIGREALARYQQATCDLLTIPNDFDDLPLPHPSESLARVRFQFSQNARGALRFGEAFLPDLEQHPGITLCLNAPVTDIRIDTASGRVTGFEVASGGDPGRRTDVRARCYVLAMGGIETPRMLLASRSQIAAGIGNAHGLVGRYFAEHFHLLCGFFRAARGTWPFGDPRVFLAPTDRFRAARQIGAAGVRLEYLNPGQYGVNPSLTKSVLSYDQAVARFHSLFPGHDLATAPEGGHIRISSEQRPNFASRVLLGPNRDALGLPEVALDWQVRPVDKATIVESVGEAARYLARTCRAEVRLADWLTDGTPDIPDVEEADWLGAGWHHIGTTRMGATPGSGVVDANLRVFDHDNLYLAGSGVFPTGGHANPTFTLLQLSLRLADHLAERLAA